MSWFFAYLYTQRRVVLLWAVTAALLWLLCSLYRLPFEPFGYAMALSGAAGVILLAAGYPAYARRCRDAELAADTPGACPAFAPPEGGPEGLEGAYQQSLRSLADAYSRTGRTAREQRDDMLDYFTMWAHQVKTPLAAMRLLLQGEEAPPRAELERELFATEGYVGMVLGYLRLGSPQNDLVLRPTPLDPVIRAGARRFARMFILKKITLDFRETGRTVLTDGKWLSFVVEQVLSNALKYTPAGGRIRIYGDGETLVIADSGIGIRPEDLPRVFEKGFTGYNGREDKKSTGIGLYLCRRVMDRLNHGISIVSRPGQGTLVRLDLSRGRRVVE